MLFGEAAVSCVEHSIWVTIGSSTRLSTERFAQLVSWFPTRKIRWRTKEKGLSEEPYMSSMEEEIKWELWILRRVPHVDSNGSGLTTTFESPLVPWPVISQIHSRAFGLRSGRVIQRNLPAASQKPGGALEDTGLHGRRFPTLWRRHFLKSSLTASSNFSSLTTERKTEWNQTKIHSYTVLLKCILGSTNNVNVLLIIKSKNLLAKWHDMIAISAGNFDRKIEF